MRSLIVALTILAGTSAFAYNPCDKYAHNDHLQKALFTVANHIRYDFVQMCLHPMNLDIQAEYINVITQEGAVEPSVRVTLHRNEDSCYYVVRDLDSAITKSRCYPTF